LLRRQHTADLEPQAHVVLLYFRLRLRHTIDLRQNLILIRLVGVHQRLKIQVSLLKGRIQIHALQAVLVHRRLDLLFLLPGDPQFFGEFRIIQQDPRPERRRICL